MSEFLDIAQIPPYGFMNADYVSYSGDVPKPMAADPALFNDMVSQLSAAIAENVWPIFAGGRWQGKAESTAVALTRADFVVGKALARFLPMPISSVDAVARANTHLQFFEEEDCFTPDPKATNPAKPFFTWGASFHQYASSAPWLATKLGEAFEGPGCAQSGGLDLRLKALLQRPRPYQMSLVFGFPEYVHRAALSSQTPSMISGHGLQSAIAGSFVAMEFAAEFSTNPRLKECWSQFMVDVGDRRVFAGVHYPSDSLASWYCALVFVGRFYGAEVRRFLWDAITTKSRVYAEVAGHARTSGSPYTPMLDWLADAASSTP